MKNKETNKKRFNFEQDTLPVQEELFNVGNVGLGALGTCVSLG